MPSVDSKSPSPSILRRQGFWITLLTVVPLLIGSLYVIENWMGARELARVKTEVAAAGIELDPHRTPSTRPPDSENFFATPLLLALGNGVTTVPEYHSVERLARWRNNSGDKSTSKLGRPELRSPTHPGPTDWALIRDVLALTDPTLALTSGGPEPLTELSAVLDRELATVMGDLEAALPRPRSVIVPTFLDRLRSGHAAWDISLEATALINLSSVINLRVHVDLATGRADRAVEGIRVLLRLAEGIEASGYMMAALLGGAVRDQALRATWTAALSPHDLSKEAWLELAEAHRTGGSFDRVSNAVRGEMIFAHEAGSALRADRKRLSETLGYYTGHSPAPRWHQWVCEVIPPGWVDFNRARSLEGGLIMIQRVGDTADPQRFNAEKNSAWAREWVAARSDLGHGVLVESTLGGFGSGAILSRLGATACVSRLGEIVCALEAYHADHQKYPSELAALVPAFLPAVPTDVDGHPLRYALDPGNARYRLWSLGEDGVDDGGVIKYAPPKPKNPGPWGGPIGDRVWQYPPK